MQLFVTAAGTKPSAFTTEGEQMLCMTRLALHAQKSVFETGIKGYWRQFGANTTYLL